MARKSKCLTCGRPLEPLGPGLAAGPICYPCFWAAKLYYENGYNEFADIPKDFANGLGDLFRKVGYLWPDDLIQEFKDKHFRKFSMMLRRWWSPKFHVEDELDLAEGMPK